MSEAPPNKNETKSEAIPTSEEVQDIFVQLVGEEKFTEAQEIRKLEDDKGLYLWEISILSEGEITEYSYMREGQYKEGNPLETAIHVTFFNKEGAPAGGHSVAKYIEGEWKLTP